MLQIRGYVRLGGEPIVRARESVGCPPPRMYRGRVLCRLNGADHHYADT